jgi:peptidoglycan hydrolase CwlO-like protein
MNKPNFTEQQLGEIYKVAIKAVKYYDFEHSISGLENGVNTMAKNGEELEQRLNDGDESNERIEQLEQRICVLEEIIKARNNPEELILRWRTTGEY